MNHLSVVFVDWQRPIHEHDTKQGSAARKCLALAVHLIRGQERLLVLLPFSLSLKCVITFAPVLKELEALQGFP